MDWSRLVVSRGDEATFAAAAIYVLLCELDCSVRGSMSIEKDSRLYGQKSS